MHTQEKTRTRRVRVYGRIITDRRKYSSITFVLVGLLPRTRACAQGIPCQIASSCRVSVQDCSIEHKARRSEDVLRLILHESVTRSSARTRDLQLKYYLRRGRGQLKLEMTFYFSQRGRWVFRHLVEVAGCDLKLCAHIWENSWCAMQVTVAALLLPWKP